VTITYDGDGNRVSEVVGGLTTNYLVDTANPTGCSQVVDELQSGTVARTYSYGLERISEKQAAGTSFYGYDGHGSVRQLTNSAGAMTDTYDYDAFGNIVNQTGSTPNNYLFAGEQYDPALNLYYNRARYLNTTTGRFWSMDSAEPVTRDPLTLHRYLYGGANPVNNSDPSGLYTQQFGYDVEDEVEKEYTADFGASDLVSFGKWSRVGGSASYRLKPDILDLRITRLAWMDIKPLSISGIGSAAASWGLYTAAFSSFGINPDVTWLQNGRIITVDTLATLVFNCGGIIFYTTNQDDYNLFNEIAQGALGFGISGAVGAAAAQLVNAVAGQGSEVQTINNLVEIGIEGSEAEAGLDLAPAA
jgi:RHS repeat-associated protein